MTDIPKPPPLPPDLPRATRLLRIRSAREDKLARDNARLREQLEAERALVEVLRSQPSTVGTRSDEETLPGVGPPRGQFRARALKRRASGAARARRWGALVVLVLGLAADGASLVYPQAMGPIRGIQRLLELLGQVEP